MYLCCYLSGNIHSQIAQLAEQRTVNPFVVGSSPTLGAMTKYKYDYSHLLHKQIEITHLYKPSLIARLGDIGSISIIYPNGTVSVELQNGSNINLVPTLDKWKFL